MLTVKTTSTAEPSVDSHTKLVLDPEKYGRLLANADSICQRAGIPRWRLEESAVGVLSEQELDWLKNYRSHAQQGRGYLLVGPATTVGPETRFGAVTAALLRNFIDARVIPLSTVASSLEGEANEGAPECTVLCVPNFYVKHQGGKQFPAWKLQAIHDFLVSRYNAARASVLYIEDWQAMQNEYGASFARHLTEHYLRIDVE